MKTYFYVVLSIACLFGFHVGYGEETLSSDIFKPATELPPNYFPEAVSLGQQGKEEGHFYSDLFNMLFTLGLLIALLLMGSWIVKRLMHTRLHQINTTSSIKIIESRALSTKSVIYLLEIQGKEIAVAESINGITQITGVTQFKSKLDAS